MDRAGAATAGCFYNRRILRRPARLLRLAVGHSLPVHFEIGRGRSRSFHFRARRSLLPPLPPFGSRLRSKVNQRPWDRVCARLRTVSTPPRKFFSHYKYRGLRAFGVIWWRWGGEGCRAESRGEDGGVARGGDGSPRGAHARIHYLVMGTDGRESASDA